MHNFSTVLRFEISRTLKKPSFWISILSLPIFLGILFGLIYISGKSSDDAEKAQESAKFSLLVQDESGSISDQTIAAFGGSKINDKQAGISAVTDGQKDAFFYYPKDLTKESVEVYNKNSGLTDNGKYTTVAKGLLKSSASAAVSPSSAAILSDTVKYDQTNYADGKKVDLIGQAVIPAIFLIIFYAVITLLGGQMLTSTTEEKENRVTEMILTSIKSKALILGKITALILLGFVQIITLLLPLIIVYIFARDALNIPDLNGFISNIEVDPVRIAIAASILITAFMLFTGLLVGIGAAVPTAKDANGFFGMVILAMFIPFYVFMAIISQPQLFIVQVLSYFPLTSPITLMLRNAVGNLSIHEALIGIGILAVFGVIALALAIRIFRYGTLEYSKIISFSTLFGQKSK